MREYIVTYRDGCLRKTRVWGYHVSNARKNFKDEVGDYPIVDVKPA